MGASNSVNARTALDEMAKDGAFKRKDSVWRNFISREEGAKFPPESGRYHLVVAMACPWAHRTLITRALKGLDEVITVSVVHPVWQKTRPGDSKDKHLGWVFANPDGPPLVNTAGLGGPFPAAFPGNLPDPINNSFSARDLYDLAGDTEGKYTVPILWDKKENTIVSNESSEILRMFNSEFNEYAKYPDLDLYPSELTDRIDEVNSWVYPSLNNGVYRCGFAKTQTAYNDAIKELTAAFDRVDSILQKTPFLTGDEFTEADLRLFVTLIRFDEVYIVYFKTNSRSVAHTPAILDYCRRIYAMSGVADTCDFEQIKTHYFCSHPDLNMFSIIPIGSNFERLLRQASSS